MLAALAARYGSKLLAVLLAVALVGAGYYYWKHEVVAEALLKERATNDAQSLKIVSDRAAEIKDLRESHDTKFKSTVQFYADHIENISADHTASLNSRMRVSTKRCNKNRGVAKADISGGSAESGQRIHSGTELAEANQRRFEHSMSIIERGDVACTLLIDAVESEFDIR